MKPHHYAVVVGIDHYPDLRELSHARRDAEDFHAWLSEQTTGGELPSKNITLIVEKEPPADRASAKPIASQVWDALDRYRLEIDKKIDADTNVFEESRLYLFVSGHGFSPVPFDAAILMADSGQDYYGNNVSCHEVVGYFELRQYFKEIVVFADCCREVPASEAFPGRPPWGRGKRSYGGVRKFWGFATEHADVALEPTSKADTPLPDDARHGYFTQAILEGLRGEAVDVEHRQIDSNSLGNYVRARVKTLTGGRQRPEIVHADTVIFRTGLSAPKHTVTLELLKSFRGPITLTLGLTQVVGTHDADGQPWVVLLEDGFYRVKHSAPGTPPFANGGLFAVEGGERHVRL